jgi:hypothetical protein
MKESFVGISDAELNRGQGIRLLNPLFISGPIVVALVALFAPVDVLDRCPTLATFCRQMIDWFPFLGGHAARSSYPQVTTLVKCLSFTFLPVCLGGGWIALWGVRQRLLERIRRGLAKPPPWWMAPACAVLFPISVVVNWWVASEPSYCQGCTTSNRLGLAFLEGGVLWFLGLIPAFVALALFVRRSVHLAR